MAKVLKIFESGKRGEAHDYQAMVIGDGTAPEACCTEDSSRVFVWDSSPTQAQIEEEMK